MKEKILLSDSVKLILGCYIYPYRNIYKFQKALDIVLELIKLLEMHGDCPSIANQGRDSESMDFLAIREKLATITLKEHTYCVALNLIRAIRNYYTDYNVHIPGAVIAALAHDIGKIPALMDSFSDTSEHHILSARKLTEMFSGKNETLAANVIRAVKNHHSDSKDGFSQMLKLADRDARQTELLKLSQNSKVAPLSCWFRLEEFYKRLEPHINYSRGPGSWKAFSFRDIVYCRPELIYEIAKGLCEEAYIVDLMFLDRSAFEKALVEILRHLRDYNMIPDQLKTTHFVGRYVIKTDTDRSCKVILTPVKTVGFYNMRELESRKIGFLKIIKSVRPADRRTVQNKIGL